VIVFEWIIAILLGAVLLSQLAKRIGAPYPALLAIGGAVLAFIPGAPRIVLEPELALALFLAPALLDAAYDTSPRDLTQSSAAP
jgi:NhaP-type Na+/H+ or K+/H+ antiporter